MNKFYLSWLFVACMALLTACGGGGDSNSSDENAGNSPDDSNKENEVKNCTTGNNLLKEGESCTLNSTEYTCQSGKVSGGGLSGETLNINDVSISCESNT